MNTKLLLKLGFSLLLITVVLAGFTSSPATAGRYWDTNCPAMQCPTWGMANQSQVGTCIRSMNPGALVSGFECEVWTLPYSNYYNDRCYQNCVKTYF